MKFMIASDIHGSEFYCKKLLEAYETEKADRLVLLGDILYHGPRNDLPKEYAPKEVIAMLAIFKREMRSYFTSPVGYMFCAIFFAVSGSSTYSIPY